MATQQPAQGIPYYSTMLALFAPDEKAKATSLKDKIQESIRETLLILLLYVVVVIGRSVGQRDHVRFLTRQLLWVWLFVFIVLNTLIKIYFPRLKENLVQAAVFNILMLLMELIKIQ